ncbi:MAG TPA: AAA family ATPase [Dehalococcoidia bacterium]|nr:AAA family ATPase [Dehalococcoidia bacterium]
MPVTNDLLAAKAVDPSPESNPDVPEPDTSFDDFMNPTQTPPGQNPPAAPRRQGRPTSAVPLVAGLCLDRALGRTGRRLLRRGGPLVVTIQVPGPGWVGAIEDAVRDLASPGTMVVTATSRKATGLSNESVGRLIAKGSLLVGIAPAVDHLAPTLVAAADLHFTVNLPDRSVISEAIRRWCRRRADADIAPTDLMGLDLPDYAAALRPGSSPQDCIARLRRAALLRVPCGVDDDVPLLADLRGNGPAREWGLELVAEIERARVTGARSPLPSCVLYGAPGTGKTLFARVVARSARIPIFTTSVAGWFANSPGFLDSVVKQYVQFFEQLMSVASASDAVIGFIDELDAIPSRAKLSGHGTDWWTPVVTGLLLQIDRVRRQAPNVVLLGATNHIERIDPALLRPGRFDHHIAIDPPDETDRAGILRTHLGTDLPDADLIQLARLCPGATGAVLANHVKAARRRARAAGRDLDLQDLLAEIMPADPRSPEEVRDVALHEAGHAILALRLGFGVAHVTIQAGQLAGGHTRVIPPTSMPDRTMLEAQVVATLAGRAADEILGRRGPTAGAVSDLREATRLVTAIHATFGLGATLAYRVSHEEAETLLRFDPKLNTTVETDLRRLMARAVALVRVHEHAIRTVAGALVARRTLVGDDLAQILQRAEFHGRARSLAGGLSQQGPAPL